MSAFVAVLAVALMALAGLVIDGGRALTARDRAQAVAEQAARAGAGQLSVPALYQGQVALDPTRAVAAARAYLQAAGATGQVAVHGRLVVVTVTGHEPTVVLDMVGVRSIAVSATASATPVSGVTKED